jgi:hypothetical protein
MRRRDRLPVFHTPDEEQAFLRDVELALPLLRGVPRGDIRKGPTEWDFPSSKTRPTEKEARAALSRVLLVASRIADVPPYLNLILLHLAELFTSTGKKDAAPPRKLIFKRLNQGHPKPDRNRTIAYCVQDLRGKKRTYDEAIKEVADKFGLSDRQVARICSKYGVGVALTSVKRTGVMTSDS